MSDVDYIISDLHLSPDTAGINRLFDRFLGHAQRDARTLTIGGDFFEVYFGVKQQREPFTAELLEKIQGLIQSGVDLRFVSGNRDFLFAYDAERSGIEAHGDQLRLDQENVVLHGDTLCLDDRSYLAYRAVVRALPLHLIAGAVPRVACEWVARRIRQKSIAKQSAPRPESYYDIKDSAVLELFDEEGSDTLICGHIHRPQERHYLREAGTKRLLVMSDWSADGAVIARRKQGEQFELVRFTPEGILPFGDAPIVKSV